MRSLFIIIFLFSARLIQAQDEPLNLAYIPDPAQNTLHIGRVLGVASLTAVAYTGSFYLIFKNGWWSEQSTHLHFENDFNYAQNNDKLGHFFAGVLLGEGFYDGFRWSGVSEFNSYMLAAGMASATHFGIEIKDGFAPTWGFSVFDVLAGTLGGLYPMAKRYVPAMKYVDFKYSYWINTRVYYNSGLDEGGVFTDDYGNETFWLSLKIGRMLPKGIQRVWPQWLGIAGGVTVTPTLSSINWWGPREYLVGLDYDFESIVNPKTYFSRRLTTYLNFYKFPAPSIQVYPHLKYYLTYPIMF